MNCGNGFGVAPDVTSPLLPGFVPAPAPPKVGGWVPPEARGRIGMQATALGLGTKADPETPLDAVPAEDGPFELKAPAMLGPGWTRVVADDVGALAARVLAIDEAAAARRWIAALARPRSVLFDIEAIRRMVVVMERLAAARSGTLPPVPPAMQYRELREIRALAEGRARSIDRDMPAPVAAAVLDGVNVRLRDLAAAGFASPDARGMHAAAPKIRALRTEVSQITGSTARVLNQLGLLRAVSRRGQTAHRPMTLDHRLGLVVDALAELARHLGREPWSAAELGLVPKGVRESWERREITPPLPSPHARSLFEWAVPAAPRHPLALSDAGLLFEIQRNPDLDYVDRLRAERARRSADDSDGGTRDSTEVPRCRNTENGKY